MRLRFSKLFTIQFPVSIIYLCCLDFSSWLLLRRRR